MHLNQHFNIKIRPNKTQANGAFKISKNLINKRILSDSRQIKLSDVKTSQGFETPKWDASKMYGLVDMNSQPNQLTKSYSTEVPQDELRKRSITINDLKRNKIFYDDMKKYSKYVVVLTFFRPIYYPIKQSKMVLLIVKIDPFRPKIVKQRSH